MSKEGILCVELAGGFLINQHKGLYSEDTAERYLVKRVDHYEQRDCPVPEHDIVVVKFPREETVPDLEIGKDYSWLKEIWQNEEFSFMSKLHDDPLQLASFCMENGLRPTPSIMKAYGGTPDYKRYCDSQRIGLGVQSQEVLEQQPKFAKYDDWSLLFGMTDRHFTQDEKKDILALGCILSGGLEERHYNRENFPSYNKIKPALLQLLFTNRIGRITSMSEFLEQYRKVQEAAVDLLTEKYPEICRPLKYLSGQPAPDGYRDVMALVSQNNNPLWIPHNSDGRMGLFEFIQSVALGYDYRQIQQIAHAKIKVYRFGCDVELPCLRNGDEQIFWNDITHLAYEKGIRRNFEISVGDAYYCLKRGRNPLHPSNRHEKLLWELPYIKHGKDFRSPLTPKREEQKPERNMNRTKPKAPKKGRGL